MKKVLTIAGSDSSGGAGMQADIKTITAHCMYAMSAVTALTAQNTTGVYGVFDAPPEFVGQQLDCIFTDIVPDAVKIGMVSNAAIIEVIAAKLKEYNASSVVLDPVMVATSGGKLIQDDASVTLQKLLIPMAAVITPNMPEAEALSGIDEIDTEEKAEKAAGIIADASVQAGGRAPAVLIKGGHLDSSADDLLYLPDEDRKVWFRAPHIDNPNTHGTGCTLSSAIACELAENPEDLEGAVRRAKEYISGAIGAGLDLGHGRGPLNHMYKFTESE